MQVDKFMDAHIAVKAHPSPPVSMLKQTHYYEGPVRMAPMDLQSFVDGQVRMKQALVNRRMRNASPMKGMGYSKNGELIVRPYP